MPIWVTSNVSTRGNFLPKLWPRESGDLPVLLGGSEAHYSADGELLVLVGPAMG